jgi:four helix bundle protein
MAEIGGFRELEAWRISMDLVNEGYDLSAAFPTDERYGLTAQLRRSLVSVPSNIAEGHARRAPKATLNHFSIALGSLAEAETQMELAIRRRYVNASETVRFEELLESSRRLTGGLRRAKQARLALALSGLPVSLLLIAHLVG